MSRFPFAVSLLAASVMAGCATPPMGPTARVMPAPGKPFEVFAGDQALCKDFASGEVDGGATMSNIKQLGTAAISTALGAGLGAAAIPRYATRGAELGGGMGALVGGAAAARGSAADQRGLQSRYDLAYTQCMYSRGNQVAGIGGPAPRYGVAAASAMPGGLGGAAGTPPGSRALAPPGEYQQSQDQR